MRGRHQSLRSGRSQRTGQQAERGGRTEPDRAGVEVLPSLQHPAPGSRGRHQQAGGMAPDRKLLLGVEFGGARELRAVHRHLVRRQPADHLVQEGLDAALPRRKVVGHSSSRRLVALIAAADEVGSPARGERRAAGVQDLAEPDRRRAGRIGPSGSRTTL